MKRRVFFGVLLSAIAVLLSTTRITHTTAAHATPLSPLSQHRQTTTDTCSLDVQIIAAPFAAVDSNMPGVQGPKVASLGARIINTGATTAQDVYVSIGDGVTPGVFPQTNGGALALLDASTATRYVGSLAPGQNVTVYWQTTYPPTFDVSYGYTIWAANEFCSAQASSAITTQSEISATANKLLPTGALLQVWPDPVRPGSIIQIIITGFTLGTIGQGPRPLSPRDAWFQPIGNLDFDPTCLRFVGSEIMLHSVINAPAIDTLYFSGLTSYSNHPSDYAVYTFVALRECTTVVQPYQEAASGTQEKYNGDYESSATRIYVTSAGNADLVFDASATPSQNVSAGETITLMATVNTTETIFGDPQSGNPAVIVYEIPPSSTFVSGSATASVEFSVQYSTDGGVTWQLTEPADPSSITHVQFVLGETVGTTPVTVAFDVQTEASYAGEPLQADAYTAIYGASPLASDTVYINSVAPPPTPSPTPTPTPIPQTQSGSDGGLESGPLDVAPSAFIGGVGEGDTPEKAPPGVDTIHKARLTVQASVTLTDVLATLNVPGTVRVDVVPQGVFAVTNAADARAYDFVSTNGAVMASALGILNIGGPHEHDYAVCLRFHGFEAQRVEPRALDALNEQAWFWYSESIKFENGFFYQQHAYAFHVFVDEASQTFHVESRWIHDEYDTNPPPYAYDYVFTVQIWSVDEAIATQLVRDVISNLATLPGWTVDLVNTTPPPAPNVFIRKASTDVDVARLRIQNTTSSLQTITLDGAWRSYLDRTTLTPFTYTLRVPPGQSEVVLPFAGLLDVTAYLHTDTFTDKAYTGSGLWFTFSNATNTFADMQLGVCRSIENIPMTDVLLAGCADLIGSNVTAPDQVGLGRTLNPNGRSVDISPYAALRFWARGDGTPVRVLLETESVQDGDFFQYVFVPDTTWRQYLIPLSAFRQRGFGTPVAWTGTDVKAVIWMNADTPTDGVFEFSVDQVVFTNRALATLREAPTDSAETNARAVVLQPAEGVTPLMATLHYSLDEGRTFVTLPMTPDETGAYRADIPGQPLGTDVVFYTMLTDTLGYATRLPVDAPNTLYRYRVDDRASLLVDDFAAPELKNRLGLGHGLFNDPTAGGLMYAYRTAHTLQLVYDVREEGQMSGYYTLLGSLDARAYTGLALLVKGEQGGEPLLVGLKDGSGYEPYIAVNDVSTGGIANEWRWVVIPLNAYPNTLDLSMLQSLSLAVRHTSGATTGRLWVKEIRFVSAPLPVVIDTFDDFDDTTNGLGYGHWVSAPNASLTATYAHGDALYSTSGAALQLDFSVQPGGYALWTSELGGLSANTNDVLAFWVRGSGLSLLPNIYLDDGTTRAYVPLERYITPNGAWQRVQIPLRDFTGVNLAHLERLQIAFEFGTGSGTLWLDNLMIGRASMPQAESRFIVIHDNETYPLAVYSADGGLWQVHSSEWWLQPSLTRGAGTATVSISPVLLDMPPGTYTGTLRLIGASGAEETVTVEWHVETYVPGYKQFLPFVIR